MTVPCVLGVDAGNSKTAALIVSLDGEVLGFGRAGTGDIYGASTEEAAVDEVVVAVDAAVAMAGVDHGDVVGAAFCLAGIDWPEDDAYWHDQLAARLGWVTTYSLRNDGFATLRAGCPDGLGVALTAGTGAAVAGRGPAGDEWSASFWITHALGGADLGGEAFKAVVRAHLGLGPSTTLTQALLSVHGSDDATTLLHAFTRRDRQAALRHADAARAVLAMARDGDAVAVEIVAAQARSFADYARVTAEQIGYHSSERIPVVLGGSVFTGHSLLAEWTVTELTARLAGADPITDTSPPLMGAALEAIAETPDGLAADVAHRLRATPLPPQLLIT